MSFLQPALLAALPLVALPLVIHLIYQRRFQAVPWGAMAFLISAQGTPRGYARIRRWLILLFRTLVILALILALSRPLASGLLGSALGGGADTVIVLLDRSPSMQQRDPATLKSKLQTGRDRLAEMLRWLPPGRVVLIDSADPRPRELASADLLTDPAGSGPVDAMADIPAMLEAARDYIAATRPGGADVWIVSDLRASDWRPGSGQWQTLRQSFDRLTQQVHFRLLAYPQPSPANLALRVTGVRHESLGDEHRLRVSLQVTRPPDAAGEPLEVPIRVEVQGASWEATETLVGASLQWTDHPVPLGSDVPQGWGRISIAADTNQADNEWYIAFGAAPARHAVIVADDRSVAGALQLAASIPPDRQTRCTSEVVEVADLETVDWQRVSLLLWQGMLPDAPAAERVAQLVAGGGQVIFFPPRDASDNQDARRVFDVAWGNWKSAVRPMAVTDWRSDQDLLQNTLSGTALPVDRLRVARYAAADGPLTPLASLADGQPLLARAPAGGVYFCSTTPAPDDSTLATDGVVLYVAVQRALQRGAAALDGARQLTAGDGAARDAVAGRWQRLAGADTHQVLSSQYGLHRGAYLVDGLPLAVNRPAAEDLTHVVSDQRLAELLGELPWTRVDDQAGGVGVLVQEVWRVFLVAAVVATLLEAGLSLPSRVPAPAGSGGG